ncbi:MAG: hypothetical protein SFY69_11050 [Planctomycetota bacterium]|nr:hypothetical protein [Planctomycetota bacterium]
MKIPPVVLKAGVPLVVAAVLWMAVDSVYLSPRAALRRDLASIESSISSLERTLDSGTQVRERARAMGAGLLGVEADDVSARFRDGLARLAEQHGLRGVTVDTARPQDASNPLLGVKGVPTSLKRDLRKDADFAIIRGTVRGTGPYEKAMATLAALQSQAWVARVEGVTLRASGKQRDVVELRAEVSTMLAPAIARLGGVGAFEPTIEPTPEALASAAVLVAGKNVFRKPAPAAPDAPPEIIAVAPVTPAPPPPVIAFAPYEDWHLHGVFEGRLGPSVLLVNTKTGAKMTVGVGGAVLDAVFVEGSGERAVFEIGGKRFEVTNGQTLAARRPLG